MLDSTKKTCIGTPVTRSPKTKRTYPTLHTPEISTTTTTTTQSTRAKMISTKKVSTTSSTSFKKTSTFKKTTTISPQVVAGKHKGIVGSFF